MTLFFNNQWFFVGLFAAVILFLVFWVFTLQLRLRKLLRGKTGQDLEIVIKSLGNDVKTLYTLYQELHSRAQTAEARLQKSIQHVECMRFNPFENAGGDQSFVIALLNEHKDGIVISSLYSRDGVRVYAKPIKDGNSPYRLSHEEEHAIKKTFA